MDVNAESSITEFKGKKRFSFKKKHKHFGYGIIETAFLHYMTPGMIIAIALPTTLIALKHQLVWTYFLAALDLNVIIVFMFVVAITAAIRSNLSLRRAAQYIKRVEEVTDKDDIRPSEVEELLTTLKTDGRLFDTNDMQAVVNNIEKYKDIQFNDQYARIVKSKVGQRIAEKRKVVSFIGGMLVMLGLIGTYTGLLRTVDTVGTVMLSMSSVGGDSGGAGMSSFISKLAEPLQGMALAFSASLFGISGSLYVSIFGTITNHAQNEFIENFSRWVDDHIPRLGDKGAGAAKIAKLPSTDDLKAWLAGFVSLSNHTNRKMGQLLYVLSKSTQTAMKSTKALEVIIQKQDQASQLIASMRNDIQDAKAHSSETLKSVLPLQGAISSLGNSMNENVHATQDGIYALQQQIQAQSGEINSANHVATQLSPVLSQLVQTQVNLNEKLDAYPQQTGKLENIENEMSAIVLQLTTLMEDINQANKNAFNEFLADDGDESVLELKGNQ